MQNVLVGVIASLCFGGVAYYQFSVIPLHTKVIELTRVTMAQELRNQEQLQTIASIQDSFQEAGKALQGLQVRNQQYEREVSEYLDIFQRHNLVKLASAKPGLIELRVNNATKEVFDAISKDSIRISNTNN
jgi:hypothetical protein